MAFESKVYLGPVTFTEREVPDVMPFGGKHAMAIHKNLGGRRNVDMMGPDPDPIKWSGAFIGADAAKRARLLDTLKDAGAELRLAWGSFSYMVVIAHFQAAYKHEWEIRYQITVQITQVATQVSFDSIKAQIDSDWNSALAVPGLSSNLTSTIQGAQSTVNAVAALQTNGEIANASLSSLRPALAAVQNAYFSVDGLLASTESSIAGINLDSFIGNVPLETFTNFSSEANNAAIAANLRSVRGYLGRIVGNLTTLGG